MKHKIGDVVLVPMKIGGGWVNSNGTGHFAYVVGEKDVSAAITAAFLDTCAAAPRVPKVGDRVRRRNESFGESVKIRVADIDGETAIIKWRTEMGTLAAELCPLSDLVVVDEAVE